MTCVLTCVRTTNENDRVFPRDAATMRVRARSGMRETVDFEAIAEGDRVERGYSAAP